MEGLWGKPISTILLRYTYTYEFTLYSYPNLLTPIEVAVEEETSAWSSKELGEETWLSEMNIERAIEEAVLKSNTIMKTMQEHQAGVENAIKEASVPFPSWGRGGARTTVGVTDAAQCRISWPTMIQSRQRCSKQCGTQDNRPGGFRAGGDDGGDTGGPCGR